MKKTARKFRSSSDAEKADRDFYKKLTGNERLQIPVELLESRWQLPRVRRPPLPSGSGFSQTITVALAETARMQR